MLNQTCISLLISVDDIVLLGEKSDSVLILCRRLIDSVKKIRLHIHTEKTVYTVVSRNEDNIQVTHVIDLA